MTSAPVIEHCGRTVAGGFVAFDIRWQGDLPPEVDVQWAMVVSEGEEEVVLVHARGGGTVSHYVVGAAGRDDLEPDADVSDCEITARFPTEIVGVAVEWPVWTAVLTVDGEDVDRRVVQVS
jgi:hypothetical protein